MKDIYYLRLIGTATCSVFKTLFKVIDGVLLGIAVFAFSAAVMLSAMMVVSSTVILLGWWDRDSRLMFIENNIVVISIITLVIFSIYLYMGIKEVFSDTNPKKE